MNTTAIHENLWQSWRHLRRRPWASLVVMMTLALAIGANTAIFTLVKVVAATTDVAMRMRPIGHAGDISASEFRHANRGPIHSIEIAAHSQESTASWSGIVWLLHMS